MSSDEESDSGNHRNRQAGVPPPGPYSWSRVLFTGAAMLGLVVAVMAVARYIPITRHYFTDADTIRVRARDSQTRDILWQPARSLSELINTTADDYEPRLSADGLTLYFVRGKAGENADVFVSIKRADGWSKPTPLEGVNSAYDDLGPEPSADGHSIYFYSDRPGGLGGYDLWVARHGIDGWQAPINLGPAVNSEFNDYGPALTPDGKTLYFSSNRPTPQDTSPPAPEAWRATLREDLFRRTYDLYMAPVTDRGFGTALSLIGLNTPYNDGAPAVSSFGDFLYFASDRPGGKGAFDLYRSRRMRGEHEPPQNLGDAINTTANELDPGLSLGGYALFFSSDRLSSEKETGTKLEGEYNLYYTTSREVFSQVERLERPPIDWAALWARRGSNFLWALLALLLFVLLLVLLRDMRQRRMGLLAKCLVASLMVHLLLMALLNTWEVTAALAKEFRRNGPIRVALASNEVGNDLTTQIRGQLTSIKPPDAPTEEIPRYSELGDREPMRADQAIAAPMASLATRERTIEPKERPRLDEMPMDAFVEQPIVRAETSKTQVTIQKTTPLDTALPADAKRIDAREPNESQINARLASAGQFEIHRAESRRRQNWKTPAPVTLDPARSADAASAERSTQTSIAPLPEPRDAASKTTATPPGGAEFVASINVPATEFTLPIADVQRQPESFEKPPAIVVPASVTPRRRLADVSTIDVTIRKPRDFEPNSVSPVGFDTTFVEPTQASSSDAPYDSAPTSGESAVADSVIPALADIALPSLEQSAPSAASEAETPLASATGEIPRAAFRFHEDAEGSDTGNGPFVPTEFREPARIASPESFLEFGSLVETANPDGETVALNIPDRDEFFPDDGSKITLDIPTETSLPENPYLQRQAERRLSIVERMGGSKDTERAVADALRWLARHQSPDGHWDGHNFDERCGDCGGETDISADNALTGLALLAFLGSGNTHVTEGPYRSNVKRALRWLVARQKRNGDLRSGETMYSHGIATIALSEAFGMSHDPDLADPVRRAARFIDAARNTSDEGGWRYDPGQAGDTSVLGWQVMALKSATMNGIPVPAEAFGVARKWMDRVDHGSRVGLCRYRPERDVSPSMTAEGMFVRQLLGLHRDDPRMTNAATYVARHLPDWDEANTYSWYYATLALFQQQGKSWKRWNETLTSELLSHQRKRGAAAGSWDPDGEWADKGGRVYQTALCALMLEVYYRYLPLYTVEMPDDALGMIEGTVSDARTESPLGGAVIHVDLPDREPVSATTDTNGRYELLIPEVPAFFAMSASRNGYAPDSRNVDAAMLKGRTLTIDFDLTVQGRDVISIEAVPKVHHLGDNRFDGTINSQFQRKSEGDRFAATFDLTSVQLPPAGSRVEIRLLAKGVQRRHRIVINDTVLDSRLDDAPKDGSFGEFVAGFDADLLRTGLNLIEIIAKPTPSDIDDFEFVNVRIYLSP